MGQSLVSVSAPGKVILAGEHAVVYGHPALVAAIDKRLTIKILPAARSKRFSGLVKFTLKQIKPLSKINLVIKSDFPVGSGLGSSAALATALVWGLKPEATIIEKNKLVKEIEDYQHGKASGVDQTIVREGGVLKFQKGKFKKVRLPLKQAILVDSGQPQETTKEMVRLVALGNFKRELKEVGELANHWQPKLIGENERLLEKIGVVGKKAQKMIRQIEAVGGMAKICGAGGVKRGSGMLLAYHSQSKKLLQLIKKNHWPYLEVKLGAPGVKYEKN